MFELDFSKGDGLIPAIAQDAATNEVLMLAYISKESWEESLRSGFATYYSRSRRKLWKKGESSGNLQKIKQILVDCDQDSVIFKIEQIGGAACHTGHRSCFYTETDGSTSREIEPPLIDPEQLYHKG